MVASAKQIEKKDLEAHLSELKSEVDKKTEELNSIVSDVDAAHALIAESKRLKKETDEYIANEKAKLNKELIDEANLKIARDADTRVAAEKLLSLKDELKQANREIARLNSGCLTAKDELESTTKKISDLRETVADLTNLVIKYEELKDEHRKLTGVKAQLDIDVADKIKELDERIRTSTNTLAQLVAECKEVERQRDDAAYKLKSYTDQLYTAMNDWAIIRARLEDKWKTTFPELNIPLNM